MDENYDVIILGTGLKECILSGLLSVAGKKVLHIDRNDYYGGESASLNLTKLFKKFKTKETKIPEILGRDRDYNVDLCPKFIMACGNLVKILIHTKVTRYLDFKSIKGSFVYKDGVIHRVPCTPQEALASGLMGFFQKRRLKNLLTFVQDFDEQKSDKSCLNKPMKQIFEEYRCDENTVNFTGHALALYLDDTYLNDPKETLSFIKRAKLYAYSVSRYGNSPYIYPVWGLGGLPEGFSRLSAVYGGTYMLNTPIDEIVYEDNDPSKQVLGIKSNGKIAYSKQILGDPSYFDKSLLKKTGQVARWIFILSHSIPNTNDCDSCQIILPAKQLKNRKSDIYVAMVSDTHKVAAEDMYIAMISATVETDNPKEELMPAVRLLGDYEEEFFYVSDTFHPTKEALNLKNGIFITSSYDATTHFETSTEEVLDIYERMIGKKLDLTISAEPEDVESLE